MTKQDLRDAVKKLGDFAAIFEKQADTGFSEDETIGADDPRLAVLRGMLLNPKGAVQYLLGILGAPVPAAPAAAARPPQPEPAVAGSLTFDEFLTNVGSAMLDAQKKLDTASAQYLKDTGNQPNVLPSVFRLPKLSASMKFAFDEVKTDKLNLVFYSSGSQESNQHQQQVDFEIVSAPAPLEAVNEARRSAPRLDLVLSPTERARVLSAALTASAALKEPPAQLPPAFEPNRALVIANPGSASYFLLYADRAEDGNPGNWLVTPDGTPQIGAVHAPAEKLSTAGAAFRRFVYNLGVIQASFLSSTGA